MPLSFLLDRLSSYGNREAIVWHDKSYTYDWLTGQVKHWQGWLQEKGLTAGTVVFVVTDFTPNAVALLLAMAQERLIIVPFSQTNQALGVRVMAESQAEAIIVFDKEDVPHCRRLGQDASNHLYKVLRNRSHPGIVLFTSGSTGQAKGVVHDLVNLLDKYRQTSPRHQRILAFLILDHMGGLDTLFYTLANAGCLVTTIDRTPDTICKAIATHRVELLPTSPTFLNLMLLSGAHERHDLSSLKKISYGSERMPAGLLARLHQALPNVKLAQSYGLSELGVLRSVSQSSDSLWMKVGGEKCEVKVVDGVLHVRTASRMLGTLHDPHILSPDGWHNTGDLVEIEGDYIKILGRASQMINVGGEKVDPAEVEEVIRELPFVADVHVYGEPQALIGNIVCADVTSREGQSGPDDLRLLKEHCQARLTKAKVPIKVRFLVQTQVSERFKKIKA